MSKYCFFLGDYSRSFFVSGSVGLLLSLLVGCGGGGGGGDIENLKCEIDGLLPRCSVDDDSPKPAPVVIPTINLLPSSGNINISLGESVTLIADFDDTKYSGVLVTSTYADGETLEISESEQVTSGSAIIKTPTEPTLYTLRVTYEANGTSEVVEAQRLVSVAIPERLALVGTLAQARSMHTATLLGNQKVLVVGGWSGEEALSSAEVYDVVSQTWKTLENEMTSARRGHTATLLPSGKVLIVGGDDGEGAYVASAEIFDPATNTFTATVGEPTVGRTGHAAVLLDDGSVLIVGGQLESGLGTETERYISDSSDVTNFDQFVPTAGVMKYARVGHQAVRLINGDVIVVGLSPIEGFETSASSFEIYNAATGVWSEGGLIGSSNTMNHQRSFPAATRLSNGDVLVSGGTGTGPKTWEIYNHKTGVFQAGGSELLEERSRHSLTLLADGDVLMVGGVLSQNQLSSIERFIVNSENIIFSTWSSEVSLNDARASHTATKLANDQVLVVGSYYDSSPVLPTVELFLP